MKTMCCNQMFRKNFKELPMSAKVRWGISAVLAFVALLMMGLEIFEVIEGNLKIELLIINLALFNNLLLMHQYKDFGQEQ